MEYIDKHDPTRIAHFNALVDVLISQGKLSYHSLNLTDIATLKSPLSAEQSHRCAYCMQIPPTGGTIDHVIPRSIPMHNFRTALRKGNYHPAFAYQQGYNPAFNPRVYPHSLAYGNLVFACSNCNGNKDCRVITPTFFNNPTGVTYQNDGVAIFPANALDQEMRTFLNGRTFKKYRLLWCIIKQTGITMPQLLAVTSKTDRLNYLRQVVARMDPRDKANYRINVNQLALDYYWNMLMSFNWFWGYYR